jgi:hypothetical protein
MHSHYKNRHVPAGEVLVLGQRKVAIFVPSDRLHGLGAAVFGSLFRPRRRGDLGCHL